MEMVLNNETATVGWGGSWYGASYAFPNGRREPISSQGELLLEVILIVSTSMSSLSNMVHTTR
jgi:hypothetical protein